MSVTSLEGECVYCPLPDDPEEGGAPRGARPKPRQLLSRPILGLLQEVEREELQRVVRETEGDALALERKQVQLSVREGVELGEDAPAIPDQLCEPAGVERPGCTFAVRVARGGGVKGTRGCSCTVARWHLAANLYIKSSNLSPGRVGVWYEGASMLLGLW